MDADGLLVGLDDEQRHAVTSPAAPLAVLAGAGAGKTRVLTRRIAWRAATETLDPARVLAVTFTRRAAGELRDRLDHLAVAPRVTAGTIHALALAQLQAHHVDQRRAFPGVLARRGRLLVPLTGRDGGDGRAAAAALAAEIEWAKARLIRPDGYEDAAARAGRTPPESAATVATRYAAYEREKRRRRLVDFDDLLWWCADTIDGDPDFAATQRWRYRHVFVDEFQDVSPAQLRLVRAWLGARADLFVAGDPDQAIYGFAGADATALRDFPHRFPGGETVTLTRNYRSTPQVVAAARVVLDPARPGAGPVAVRPDGPTPTVTGYASEDDEAHGVAERIHEAHRADVAWSAIAVLYRTNAQSAAFEAALDAAGIPHRVRGAGAFLRRPEVHAARRALRDAARAAPGRPFAALLVDLVDLEDATTAEQAEHVDALVRLGHEYLDVEPGPGSLAGFDAFLGAALRDDSPDDDSDAAELLTFHRAKGLEFQVVFVTGLERGLVPLGAATTPDARDEERRLLYVALSRAADHLHCTWAESRTVALHRRRRTASPWLADLAATIAADVPPPATRPDVAGLRARLDAASPRRPDRLLVDLERWRATTARAAGVPAHVVLPDAAVRAVAATRPSSADALRAVPGLDRVRAARHGPALLELVRARPDPGGRPDAA